MKLPPLLPEETFERVARTANADGMSVMAIAGLLALAAASVRDFTGAGVGLAVAAAGAIELHGLALLRAGERRGMDWVIASQPYLMGVLLGYCAWKLAVPELPVLPQEVMRMLQESAELAGRTAEEQLRWIYDWTYRTVALVTVIYQGGMTYFYWKRRTAVMAAVGTEVIDD